MFKSANQKNEDKPEKVPSYGEARIDEAKSISS